MGSEEGTLVYQFADGARLMCDEEGNPWIEGGEPSLQPMDRARLWGELDRWVAAEVGLAPLALVAAVGASAALKMPGKGLVWFEEGESPRGGEV